MTQEQGEQVLLQYAGEEHIRAFRDGFNFVPDPPEKKELDATPQNTLLTYITIILQDTFMIRQATS